MNNAPKRWSIPSAHGRTDVVYTVESESGDNLVGHLRFSSQSVQRESGLAWHAVVDCVGFTRSELGNLADSISAWLKTSEEFEISFSTGETRVDVGVRNDDESLVLGTGKAGLHIVWDSIGLPKAEVAYVIDESCMRLAVESLLTVIERK